MRFLAHVLAPMLVALGALGACTSRQDGPSQEELKAHWESQNVYPAAYKTDLLAFLRTYLNDPSNVRSAGVSVPQRKSLGFGERFIACVRYDARKSSGEYAGVKEHMAVFVSGKLDRLSETTRENREQCKDAVYAPFPELQQLTR